MKLRSSIAAVLVALMVGVSWSAVLCETSCVLPGNAHACCAADRNAAKPALAAQMSCAHPARTIVSTPAPGTTLAMTMAAAGTVVATPMLSAAAGARLAAPNKTTSPPKFNLRI